MRGTSMQLWYYNATGIISMQDTISMEKDFGLFAAVIVAFGCCSDSQWGCFDIVEENSGLNKPFTFPLRTLKGCTIQTKIGQIELCDKIRCQRVLVGRSTVVYSVKIHKAGGPDQYGVVKMSYQVTTRTPEWVFIEQAREKGVEHLPEVLFYQDYAKSSDGVWRTLISGNNPQYEDRVLRVVVFPHYTPISSVICRDNFTDILSQLIDCKHMIPFSRLTLTLT
jgi:Fungal protein kinase